ncbi:MAG TPA: isocitrate lyase/phosphoenolpyruvate mutase family protein, partial [Xanthomonadales bacterium]|nr:isocitrate lyase/phosphoenolpyruvate mutase family protein [Xanthomonadales bacterium]
IVDVVRVPVTADVEGGYGDVAETVRGIVDAGACGINLEDSAGDGPVLHAIAAQAARIAAARRAADAAGAPIFVNARIDVYLKGVGAPDGRFDETVARAHAYVAAGADGVFVPGVVDAATIRALAQAIDAPLNVMAAQGAPDVGTLGKLGVARVSLGPYVMLALMKRMRHDVAEILRTGRYDTVADRMTFAEADGLMPDTRGA